MPQAKRVRVLPQSLEAEQAVLGAMLLERRAIVRAVGLLVESDFYREAHRIVFQGATTLLTRNVDVDLTTLAAELENRGLLEQAGGRLYLAQLLDTVPTSEHVGHYAAIVAQKALLRRVISVASDVVETAWGDVEDAEELVESAAARLQDIARQRRHEPGRDIFIVMTDAAAGIAEWRAHPRVVTGVPSGLHRLDVMTDGFAPGDLSVVSGRQGVGKTVFAMQAAMHNASEGRGVLYISLEMSEVQFRTRMVANEARVDSQAIRRGTTTEEEHARCQEAAGRIAEWPFHLWCPGGITVAQAVGYARELLQCGLGMVVIDHVGRLQSGRRYSNRVDEETDRAQQLRLGAKDLGVALLALAQGRKPTQERMGRAPGLEDLRGSGALLDEPSLVIILFEAAKAEQKDPPPRLRDVKAIVTKNRHGGEGVVSLTFEGWSHTFRDEAWDTQKPF